MGVEFEENKINTSGSVMYSRFQASDKKPWLINFLLKTGLIRRESQAVYFVIAFCVICLIIAIYLFNNALNGPEIKVDYTRFQ
jgi:hypothetical protein